MSGETMVQDLDKLLDYLHQSRGFDFGAYKRSSLQRRIEKRMQTIRVESVPEYIDYLEVHPDEFARLFDTILINVTGFLRDPPAWESLRETVIPRILQQRGPGEPIRVWSAGCASGEEAYTVAMVLCEAMGVDAFRERVKIYATDVDEHALAEARQAVYGERSIENVSPEWLEKYFTRTPGGWAFHKDLRRSVIFGRHDILQDAPISRVDLLVCRNTLMYFNAEAQARILARFHFALREDGFLFLGKAETLITHDVNFRTVDLRSRIFARNGRGALRDRSVFGLLAQNDPAAPGPNHLRVREAAADAVPLAMLVFDVGGTLVLANAPARALFGLGAPDLGRRLQDLEVSYRPLELRSCIERVYADQQPLVRRDIEWQGMSEVSWYDVHVTPHFNGGVQPIGVSVCYVDVTRYRRLQDELHRSSQELETALEELQSTNEELETTNEELQSTVEELETTNEELQSTNEELETMNEELQSTNEELTAINTEVRDRGDESQRANRFLQAILAGIGKAVVVVDQDLYVRIWNHVTEDMWGLRAEEVHGKNFLNLDIGLPVEKLRAPIRGCLQGEKVNDLLLEATNRRGRAVQVRVTCNMLDSIEEKRRGVILMMEEVTEAEREGVEKS